MQLKDIGHAYVTRKGEIKSYSEGESLPENWVFSYFFSEPADGPVHPHNTLIHAKINSEVSTIEARGVLRICSETMIEKGGKGALDQRAYAFLGDMIRRNRRESFSRLNDLLRNWPI